MMIVVYLPKIISSSILTQFPTNQDLDLKVKVYMQKEKWHIIFLGNVLLYILYLKSVYKNSL